MSPMTYTDEFEYVRMVVGGACVSVLKGYAYVRAVCTVCVHMFVNMCVCALTCECV